MSNSHERLFREGIEWHEVGQENCYYTADFHGTPLKVKINAEFPETPLYTLFIGKKHLDFDNWPNAWDR